MKARTHFTRTPPLLPSRSFGQSRTKALSGFNHCNIEGNKLMGLGHGDWRLEIRPPHSSSTPRYFMVSVILAYVAKEIWSALFLEDKGEIISEVLQYICWIWQYIKKWRIAQICYGLKNTRIRPVGGSHDSRIGRIRDNFEPKGIKLCPLPYRWVGFPFRPKRTCSRQRAKGKGCSNTRWYICLLMTRLDSTTVFHYHKLMSERVYSFGIGWELERHGLSCFSTNAV